MVMHQHLVRLSQSDIINLNFINSLMGNYLNVPDGTKADKKLLKFFRKCKTDFVKLHSKSNPCL